MEQQFKNDLDWYMENWDWILNGNYGSNYYDQYKQQYEEAIEMTEKRKIQSLRQIIINSFTTLVSIELGCSYGHAQKIIVKVIGLDKLKKINREWVKQLKDIYE